MYHLKDECLTIWLCVFKCGINKNIMYFPLEIDTRKVQDILSDIGFNISPGGQWVNLISGPMFTCPKQSWSVDPSSVFNLVTSYVGDVHYLNLLLVKLSSVIAVMLRIWMVLCYDVQNQHEILLKIFKQFHVCKFEFCSVSKLICKKYSTNIIFEICSKPVTIIEK